ncbi:MAG: hypothetical protein CMI16_15820 [Opitutaceae bacterium]|nr:hypothetical protein [Opitutaceae bacterium]
MSKLLLQTLGWSLAHTPELILRAISGAIGWCVYLFRKRTFLSNLHHAFPEKPPEKHRELARESARRLIETGLLSLATPFLNKTRLKTIVTGAPSFHTAVAKQLADPEPVMLATAHMAYWEVLASMPLVTKGAFPEMGAIFRPMDNPSLDAWVKSTRERYGINMLSRKEGFQEALRMMRRKGMIGLLFDQNAGLQGALSTLFGRVCSTSELSGLLTHKFNARVYAMYSERLGFWRVRLHWDPLSLENSTAGVTLGLNHWLENKLTESDNFCASWLWAHERWKNQDIPNKRLRLEAKRNLIAEDLVIHGIDKLPQRTRICIRLPNWLGDVVMALPLLRAIRASRPDAEITLVAKPAFHSLLESRNIAEHLIAIPAKGFGYFTTFWKLRNRFPDCYLLFTNSLRGDLEAWLTGSPQRFGILRSDKRRPLLTHHYEVPADFDERKNHQLTLWTHFLEHFGLNASAELSPLNQLATNSTLTIGLIAGSENNPEKRWPVGHWCELINQLPKEARIILFGTDTDRTITDEISARVDRPVENLAGRTKLPEYCELLTNCSLLITNDTGGMHLANALGTPLIALFGPTNPIRTGPVFSGFTRILQPLDCAAEGGSSLNDLKPEQVLAATQAILTPKGDSE